MAKLTHALLASLIGLAGCALPPTAVAPGANVQAAAQPIQRLAPDLPAGTPRQATLLTYAALDDGLSFHANTLVAGLERLTTSRLHSLAFADYQGPDNSYLYYLQRGPQGRGVTSPRSFLKPNLKEVTANDPAILAATVNWAFANYPSQFRAMTVFSHGMAYMGLGTDETQVQTPTKELMSVAEFGKALRTGLKGRKLHVLNMLACLMGNVEFAYELRDVAEVLVASQNVIYAETDDCLNVSLELGRQLADGATDPRAIAKRMVIAANARKEGSHYFTASAIDLGRMNELKSAVNGLSNALLQALPRHEAAILAAYDAVPAMSMDLFAGVGTRDLWSFCNHLQSVPDPAVRQAADQAKQVLKRALIHTRDQEGEAANGLSILMPARDGIAELMATPEYKASLGGSFVKATSWNRFIQAVAAKTP